jgi:hypothetical protein
MHYFFLLSFRVFAVYGTSLKLVHAAIPPIKPDTHLLDIDPLTHSPFASHPGLHHVFIAGCMAGVVQSFVLTPADLIKCRLQVQTARSQYSGPIDVIRQTLRVNGVQGLYRGLGATLIRGIFKSRQLLLFFFFFFPFFLFPFMTRLLSPPPSQKHHHTEFSLESMNISNAH